MQRLSLGADCQAAVYIVRPDLDAVSTLIAQVKLQGPSKETHILFVPRRTIECDELLEKHSLNDERIQYLSLDLLQLDDDLLSLELPGSFANCLLNDDDTYKIYVQNSLQRLETLYNKIKFKYAKGPVSTQILQNLQTQQSTASNYTQSTQAVDSEIDCLLMLDRGIDLVSPFCVQQTYEGSIDEAYGISTNSVDVAKKVLNPQCDFKEQEDRVTLTLNSEDFIYREVRSMSIHSIGIVTKQRLQDIMNILSRKDNPNSI